MTFRKISLWLPLVFLLFTLGACGGSAGIGSKAPAQKPVAFTIGPPLARGPITYVALGASDAVGVGSSLPGSQGYVPLIAKHLSRGSRLVNLGISGIRLHEALDQELPVALSTSPDLITIWLVTNDFVGGISYDHYMHDLNTLLAQLRTNNSQARIVMANLPDLTRLPAFKNQKASQKAHTLQEIKRWNAQIAREAAQYQVVLVDLYSHDSQLTAHPEYISSDGFHPSAQGYIQLANYFWQAAS